MSLFKPSADTAKDFHAKVLVWGPSGAGKTHFALSAPRPALIDVENRGAAFARRDGFSFVHAEIANLAQLAEAFKEIRDGRIDCETIVVDSGSAIYYALVEEHTKPNAVTDWVAVNRRYLRCLNFLFSISGKNAVVTAHSATKLNRTGNDFTKAGEHFVSDERLRFSFDYVLRLESKGDAAKGATIFHVEKSSSPSLPVGSTHPGLTWEKFVSLVGGSGKTSGAGSVSSPAPASPSSIPGQKLGYLKYLSNALGLGVGAKSLAVYVSEESGGRTKDPAALYETEADHLIQILEAKRSAA